MAAVNLAKLGEITVKSAVTDKFVQLKTLWQEETSVVFFLRRFGCVICRWTANEISKLKDTFEANDIRLIGIGPESVGLQEFIDGSYFKGELYIDEAKESYNQLGFKRYNPLAAIPAALGKKVRNLSVKANEAGIQGNFQGDLFQSGGLLIVSKGGDRVIFNFKQESPGDYVPLETLLQHLGITADVTESPRPQCSDVCGR